MRMEVVAKGDVLVVTHLDRLRGPRAISLIWRRPAYLKAPTDLALISTSDGSWLDPIWNGLRLSNPAPASMPANDANPRSGAAA
jgi:hypothetical protein